MERHIDWLDDMNDGDPATETACEPNRKLQSRLGPFSKIGRVQDAVERHGSGLMDLFFRIEMRDRQDRNVQLAEHALGHRSKQQPLEVRPATGSHDDKVDFLFIDDAEKLLADFAALHNDFEVEPFAII